MRQYLCISAAQGLGALAWAAGPAARRVIVRQLRETFQTEPEALEHGRAAVAASRRSRRPRSAASTSETLEAYLRVQQGSPPVEAICSYLEEAHPMSQLEYLRTYARELVAVLGSERIVALFEDAPRYVDIDSASALAPLVPASVRRPLLGRAVQAQLRHGDSSTLVDLLGCARLMTLTDAARLFCGTFGRESWLNLAALLGGRGDIFWMAPLIRQLGGDEALLAAAQEILALQPLLAPESPRPRAAGRKIAHRPSGRRR